MNTQSSIELWIPNQILKTVFTIMFQKAHNRLRFGLGLQLKIRRYWVKKAVTPFHNTYCMTDLNTDCRIHYYFVETTDSLTLTIKADNHIHIFDFILLYGTGYLLHTAFCLSSVYHQYTDVNKISVFETFPTKVLIRSHQNGHLSLEQ